MSFCCRKRLKLRSVAKARSSPRSHAPAWERISGLAICRMHSHGGAWERKGNEKLFDDDDIKKFRSLFRTARLKLEVLNAAVSLNSLRVPPGNRLEQLKGDRKGQHSIRVNNQWRVCFVWKNENAFDVEIVGYHQEEKHGKKTISNYTRRYSFRRIS